MCTTSKTRLLLAAFIAVIAAAGCAKKFIPNTKIPDNPFNREVIAFCEQYRLAVEAKDIGKLLVMASPDYYEDGGTPDGDDDFDFSSLKDVLQGRFAKVKTIRYDIKYRKVIDAGKVVNVDYTWSGSFQITRPDGQDSWFRKVEDNRLVLVKEKDKYKIISGM